MFLELLCLFQSSDKALVSKALFFQNSLAESVAIDVAYKLLSADKVAFAN